jgi:tetratricopeptide (TPR) repeat protein
VRTLIVAFLAVVLTVSGALGLAGSGGSSATTATTPTSAGSTGSAVHPGAGRDLTSTIEALQQTLERVPGDYQSWATLGLAYVEQARITGNPTYYVKADAAVARSLQVSPDDNSAAHAAQAALDAARHEFSAALDEADEALAIDPYDPGALAVRVDALTELGRYHQQLRALRVADRRQPGVPVFARYSYAYELRGHLAKAAAVLSRGAGTASPADIAFLATLRADLDRRLGDLAASARQLRTALRQSPGYLPALASRARLAVAHGHLEQAQRRWRSIVAQLPLPEYVTELGELDLALGHRAEARRQFSVVTATTRLLAAAGANVDLELALFEADHGSPADALSVARAEWQRRKSIHVADVLAWALHVNGRDRAALRLTRKATRLGTEEARLWLHRGRIEAALGLDAAARSHLRHGLEVDPGASPWQAQQARAVLAGLGPR